MKFRSKQILIILTLLVAGLALLNYSFFRKIPSPRRHVPERQSSRKPQPRPNPPEDIPSPAVHLPRISIVIDDLGPSLAKAEKLYRISPNITLAVMPFEADSGEITRRAALHRQTVILHLPLEPQDASKIASAPYMLLLEQNDAIILKQLRRALDSLPGIAGVNNHMGSRFTEDRPHMELILGEMKLRGLFFLDSRTTPHSVGYAVAGEMGIPALKRDVFLDNQIDDAAIAAQLDKLVEVAQKNGQAIGIGHPHAKTLEQLEKFVPELPGRGVELVKLPELLKK